MYIHIGTGKVLRKKNIVGIFDMDRTTMSKTTKGFLTAAERDGRVHSVTTEIPRSFILTDDGNVYLTQISPHSIAGRAGNN